MAEQSGSDAVADESLARVTTECGPPIGVFEGTSDIGLTRAGATVYNSASGRYSVTGGGADVWGRADALHFAWLRFLGDGGLAANISFPPGIRSCKEKAVLMIRQKLDPGSAYVAVVLQGDGRMSLQYRQSQDAVTFTVPAFQQNSATFGIERSGGRFTALGAARGSALRPIAMIVLPHHDPVYMGIGLCAHEPEGLATAYFSGVRAGKL
jgi:TolB protein